ncbi:MAG TPA: TorF family putative porin [Burkholderiales bacterium]
MRKTILSLAVAAAVAVPSLAFAQATAPAAPPAAAPEPSPFTGNVGLFSQYIFRGLTQTAGKPALQGGADYAHSSGLYVGTWLSNVSWISDTAIQSGAGARNSSLEWDMYGGYKNTFGKSDFGYDVGMLQYYYPGVRMPGAVTANTREVYGALTWKWLSAKLSRSVLERTFGVDGSKGTTYLDLSATYPVTDQISLVAHWGRQKFSGSSPQCTSVGAGASNSNDTCATYKDWKLGASYSLPQSWSVGGYYTGTKMTGQQRFNYTLHSYDLGKSSVTAYVQKTF